MSKIYYQPMHGGTGSPNTLNPQNLITADNDLDAKAKGVALNAYYIVSERNTLGLPFGMFKLRKY